MSSDRPVFFVEFVEFLPREVGEPADILHCGLSEYAAEPWDVEGGQCLRPVEILLPAGVLVPGVLWFSAPLETLELLCMERVASMELRARSRRAAVRELIALLRPILASPPAFVFPGYSSAGGNTVYTHTASDTEESDDAARRWY